MLSPEVMLLAISVAMFGAVAGVVYYIGAVFSQRELVHKRLGPGKAGIGEGNGGNLLSSLTRKIDISLHLDHETRSKQRFELLQAGFFGSNAVRNYNVIRFALIFIVPAFMYLVIVSKLHTWSAFSKTGIMVGAIALAYYMPRSYLDRKTRHLQQQYRIVFPDFLDLLMVCMEAGLSLEAALERITREIGTANREMAINLAIMGAEIRAGRGTIDAIKGFADRLGLEEAKSLAMLLQQSLELGSDISQALKTFGDEMRDKRLARAEERAQMLPVKLVLPICLFIFRTILISVLGPVLMTLLPFFGALTGGR